jgi:thymidylate synthase (FAD)
MKPIKSKDLLELDQNMKVVMLRQAQLPQTLVWQAGKNDYSEEPIHTIFPPNEKECGKWVIEQLLANERGHWGPLEHPAITFDCVGFVHNVIVQARTHRVGVTFDVQSQRYTGRRVLKVAKGELRPQEVFYVRPEGLYLDRKGHKYEWTQKDYERELKFCVEASERYTDLFENRGMAEEHLRDYLPQNIRQNFVVTWNLRSALHFLDLRAKLDAQVEIQALSEAMIPAMKEWVPEIFSYYEEKRLHKARLSP